MADNPTEMLYAEMPSLDQARDNLYAQSQLLQQFAAGLFQVITRNLAQQQKSIAKATRPLLTTAGRAVGVQMHLLNQVTEPLLTQAQSAIAEQTIQLGNAGAEVLGMPPSTRPTAPVTPLALPRAFPAKTRPDLPAPAESPALEPAPSESPGQGETPGEEEAQVTNVVAIRKCDMDALLSAMTRPHYGPLVDAVNGLPKQVLATMTTYYGADFAAAVSDDPTNVLIALLADSTRPGLEGRLATS